MTSRPPITPPLLESGIAAILRGRTADHVDAVAGILIEEGLTCLELTLTTPGAVPALRRLNERHPSIAFGAGTVRTVEQAGAALDAGASFLASPVFDRDILSIAASTNIPCYLGAFTPTEIWHAWQAGTAAIKLFPASTGGVAHLREIRAPLPDIAFFPTGGISLDDISGYLAAGAVGVGIGNSLIGDALHGGDPSQLRNRARRAREAVAAFQARSCDSPLSGLGPGSDDVDLDENVHQNGVDRRADGARLGHEFTVHGVEGGEVSVQIGEVDRCLGDVG